MAFLIVPKISQSLLYWKLPKPLLEVLRMHKRQKYAELLFEVLCTCAKDTK